MFGLAILVGIHQKCHSTVLHLLLFRLSVSFVLRLPDGLTLLLTRLSVAAPPRVLLTAEKDVFKQK